MRRIILSLGCLLVLVLAVSGVALAMDSRQQEGIESALEKLLPQPQEYPQGAQELTRGSVTADDQSHPINRFHTMESQKLPESLFEYRSAYELSLVVADGQGAAFAGYYLYAYADPKQAQAATAIVQKIFADEHGVQLAAVQDVAGRTLRGTSQMFIGSEGDAIYYFVGTQDNVLTLFILNGMSNTTKATYETLLKGLLSR